MRKFIGVLGSIFFIFVVGQVVAQDVEDIIDFDTEIKQLSTSENVAALLTDKKILILDGTVLSMDSADTRTEVSVTLQQGEWEGFSRIHSYSVKIRFVGEQWVERFLGHGADDNTDRISIGTRVIVAARLRGWNETLDMAEAEALVLRVIN